jgi:hypothetical protein
MAFAEGVCPRQLSTANAAAAVSAGHRKVGVHHDLPGPGEGGHRCAGSPSQRRYVLGSSPPGERGDVEASGGSSWVSKSTGHYWLMQSGGARATARAGAVVMPGGAADALAQSGAEKTLTAIAAELERSISNGVAESGPQQWTQRLPSGPVGDPAHEPATAGEMADAAPQRGGQAGAALAAAADQPPTDHLERVDHQRHPSCIGKQPDNDLG